MTDPSLRDNPPWWPRPAWPTQLAWAIAALSMLTLAVGMITELTDSRAGIPADTRDWLLAGLCAPIGARIAAHTARNACGWLILAVGLLSAITILSSLPAGDPAAWLRQWSLWPGYGLLFLVVLLFPNGRPLTRRWRWVAIVLAITTGLSTVALASLTARESGNLVSGDRIAAAGWEVPLFLATAALTLAGGGLAVLALVLRIRRTPRPRRGPLLWAGANAVLLLVAVVLEVFEGVPVVWLAATLAIPITAAIGVLRYGLYDIGLLVHRSLLNGLVTAAIIVVYAGAVALATRTVPQAAGPVAAAVTVLALFPLRQAVQAALGRGLHGLGARPYEMLTHLSRRIGVAQTPEEVLVTAMAAIGDGLKIPFAAVHLGDRMKAEAVHGRQRPWPVVSLRLSYRGRTIGRLVVQQRSPDEPWSRRERTLLNNLAEQLGPPAASVALTRDLQTARERLVQAREEELRRLQRELHDGIGPALVGTRMLAQVARTHPGTPVGQDALASLESDLAGATVELRRIIDNLRPPALDGGLAAALDTAARRHRGPELDVTVTVTEALDDLPAAVEVASYRIVDEALTNVAKHARASRATVALVRQPAEVTITVEDDGVGLRGQQTDGVGLSSMAERCQELGGTLRVVPLAEGTRIIAAIPLG
ncbi:hypothetical protein GCM10027280_58320 [Micromonospora polyrhachis]|uniref:Signal transduction histidine kinase n=1 Tax=Micromonospora polyrhachis TaxID=1282883 RepID=A0A7W7WMB2_9ACTN|nr:histidine kinase [Micromonospora polyrhachis]MBB4956645.1 signal transduction histidine kinase [Micromonospora polyrhachis]